MAAAPLVAKKAEAKKVVNPLFEKRPKNFGIGKFLHFVHVNHDRLDGPVYCLTGYVVHYCKEANTYMPKSISSDLSRVGNNGILLFLTRSNPLSVSIS